MIAFTCLCCGRPVIEPGEPVPRERMPSVYTALRLMGFTREQLLGEHRSNLRWTLPGLVEWIEEPGCQSNP
jgi:hypothetical protein